LVVNATCPFGQKEGHFYFAKPSFSPASDDFPEQFPAILPTLTNVAIIVIFLENL
jgi:hypothetical protein